MLYIQSNLCARNKEREDKKMIFEGEGGGIGEMEKNKTFLPFPHFPLFFVFCDREFYSEGSTFSEDALNFNLSVMLVNNFFTYGKT